MEREIATYKSGLPETDNINIIEENGYYAALKKNEESVLKFIESSGENLSGEQIAEKVEAFFADEKDPSVYSDILSCPILGFSDTLLDKAKSKVEKWTGPKTKFFEVIGIAASKEKYRLKKTRLDKIVEEYSEKLDIESSAAKKIAECAILNGSEKVMQSVKKLTEALINTLSKRLDKKGLFGKGIKDEEKERLLAGFTEYESSVFNSLSDLIRFKIKNGQIDLYEKCSQDDINSLLQSITEFKAKHEIESRINSSCENFLMEFINYYVTFASMRSSNEGMGIISISNWKLNSAFSILGKYTSNNNLKYELIKKYVDERDLNGMVFFPFEIIQDILLNHNGSDEDVAFKKTCLEVVFNRFSNSPATDPARAKTEALVSEIVTDENQNESVQLHAFNSYFNAIHENRPALIQWLRDSICAKIYEKGYRSSYVQICKAILLEVKNQDAFDDGLDGSREKAAQYLCSNFKSDMTEIRTIIKSFLTDTEQKKDLIKEKIYNHFIKILEDPSEKIQLNKELLSALEGNSNSRELLTHICSETLDEVQVIPESQRSVVSMSVDFLLNNVSEDEIDDPVFKKIFDFILSGKDFNLGKNSLEEFFKKWPELILKSSELVVERILEKNSSVNSEYDAYLLKSAVARVLEEKDDKSSANKILIKFLSADFTEDRFSLVEYAKKSVNYIWDQNEKNEETWPSIKFDFIDRISRCQNVEILQHAFRKSCNG